MHKKKADLLRCFDNNQILRGEVSSNDGVAMVRMRPESNRSKFTPPLVTEILVEIVVFDQDNKPLKYVAVCNANTCEYTMDVEQAAYEYDWFIQSVIAKIESSKVMSEREKGLAKQAIQNLRKES